MDHYQIDYVTIFLAIVAVWIALALVGITFIARRIFVTQRAFSRKREQIQKDWFNR